MALGPYHTSALAVFLGLFLVFAGARNAYGAEDGKECQLVAALGDVSQLLQEVQNLDDPAQRVRLRQIISRTGRRLANASLDETLRGPSLAAVAKEVKGFVKTTAELAATGPLPAPFPHLPAIEQLVGSFVCVTKTEKPSERPEKTETLTSSGQATQRPSGKGWPYSPSIWKELLTLFSLLVIGGLLHGLFRRNGRQNRRAERHFCHVPARLAIKSAQFDTIILDLSQLGAKLRNPGLPDGANLITVRVSGISKPANIVWSNQHFIGVVFGSALKKSELTLILDEPKVTSVTLSNPQVSS